MKNQMKLLLTLTCLIYSINTLGIIIPSQRPSVIKTNDVFVNYQWYLNNNGQTLKKDIDDIRSFSLTSDPKIQIGWKNYDSQMKQDVRVAIIDTGVDTTHPELKGMLLPGINLTTKDERFIKNYADNLGHGTHMSGIIAAAINNAEGITGISNRIQIIPIKVWDRAKSMNKNSPTSDPTKMFDRIDEALDFAMKNQARVINFSMGWARGINTNQVLQKFQKAVDADILIVAASGNDHHDGQLFPCAYKSVVCVGYVDNTGELSTGSNFGGHVDMLAPGVDILSLWPKREISLNFGSYGYEVISGSSQAAAMVSGAAAVLRGLYPTETAAEIRIRLLLGAVPMGHKTQFGLLNLERSVNLKLHEMDFVAPIFKGLELVEVDPEKHTFELPVAVEHLEQSPRREAVKIAVRSLTSEIELGPIQGFKTTGTFPDIQSSASLNYQVDLDGQSFDHHILLTMPLEKSNHQDYVMPLGEVVPELRVVTDKNFSPEPSFWSFESLKEEGLKLSLWQLGLHQMVKKSALIPDVKVPLVRSNLVSDDFDIDGRKDYLFAGTVLDKDGKANEIRLVYLDQEFKPLKTFSFKYEGAIPILNENTQFQMVKFKSSDFGVLRVPLFWSDGSMTPSDQNPDFFAFERNDFQRRLYYLEPQKTTQGLPQMVARTLWNSKLEKFVRNQLDLNPNDDVSFIGMTFPTDQERRDGDIRLLIHQGNGILGSLYSLTINFLKNSSDFLRAENLVRISSYDKDIDRNVLQEGWEFINNKLSLVTDFVGIYTKYQARSILQNHLQLIQIEKGQETITNLIQNVVSSQNDHLNFFETDRSIRVQGEWKGQTIDAKAQVYRSTFLPGAFFTQKTYPVLIGQPLRPGLVFDNSDIFSDTIIGYHLDAHGNFVNSIRHTVKIPKGCLTLPPYVRKDQASLLLFQCEKKMVTLSLD